MSDFFHTRQIMMQLTGAELDFGLKDCDAKLDFLDRSSSEMLLRHFEIEAWRLD